MQGHNFSGTWKPLIIYLTQNWMNLIEFARFIKNNIFLINSNMKEFPNSNESIVRNNCIVAKSIQQKLELIR